MKMLLNEMPWFSAPEIEFPTSTGRKVTVDFIDVRIEDMIRAKIAPPAAAAKGFFGLVPDSSVVVTDDGVIDSPAREQLEGRIQLPDNWWEFVYGLYHDKNVKASIKPRTEQGEKTQEELDMEAEGADRELVGAATESLERRLGRVLCRPF